MIVLDTNVISETWKVDPDISVLNWLDDQLLETLFVTSITVAELRFGIATMPKGKRRAYFAKKLEEVVLPSFNDRILSFDLTASNAYAILSPKLELKARQSARPTGILQPLPKQTASQLQLGI